MCSVPSYALRGEAVAHVFAREWVACQEYWHLAFLSDGNPDIWDFGLVPPFVASDGFFEVAEGLDPTSATWARFRELLELEPRLA